MRSYRKILEELRYIEQWGSGILNAIRECRKMSLPEPVGRGRSHGLLPARCACDG